MDSEWQVPPAGSIVAADSIEVDEDLSKGLYFSVYLKVPQTIGGGGTQYYELDAKYGHGEAKSEIVMPRGGEHLQPLIHRKDAHHFIIGFIPGKAFGGDTSFLEYYQVTGNMQGISIEPLKSFQIN
ncbi:MAG: hypothetical protein ABI169_09815 [Chitinophagaceae bacterium]